MQGSTEEDPADYHRWGGRVPFAFVSAVALFLLMDSLLWRSERSLRFVDRSAPHWRSDSLVTAAIVAELFQLFEKKEQVVLDAPILVRTALYLVGIWAFIVFGRFEGSTLIYFQF